MICVHVTCLITEFFFGFVQISLGVWRWYHETMLDCCVPLSDIQSKGITFSQFICLAECHGCAFDVISQFDSESFSDHAAADPNFLCQVHQVR